MGRAINCTAMIIDIVHTLLQMIIRNCNYCAIAIIDNLREDHVLQYC